MKIFLSVFLTLMFGSSLVAQKSIISSGGEAAGTGGTVSYSVGQLVDKAHSGVDGSVSEGVQQPFEISVSTSLEEAKGVQLTMMTYPNPVAGSLTLSIQDITFSNLTFQLCDLNGKVLKVGQVTNQRTQIKMEHLAASTYILNVYISEKGNTKDTDTSQKQIKVFKIIKN